MIKINKRVEYALIVLKHFQSTNNSELTTARMICEKYHTPFDTTSKVMQIMNSNKILESIQGVKGGYKVAIDLKEINYLQLTEIVEGRKISTTCTPSKCNMLNTCNITGPIQKLNEYLNHFFMGLSIKQLLEETADPKTLFFNKPTSI